MALKTADGKGRISFGSKYANSQWLIKQVNEFEFRIVQAATIPMRELCLWKNPKALKSVQVGIEQAKKRQFSESPPDLDADWEELSDVEE